MRSGRSIRARIIFTCALGSGGSDSSAQKIIHTTRGQFHVACVTPTSSIHLRMPTSEESTVISALRKFDKRPTNEWYLQRYSTQQILLQFPAKIPLNWRNFLHRRVIGECLDGTFKWNFMIIFFLNAFCCMTCRHLFHFNFIKLFIYLQFRRSITYSVCNG